MRTSRPLCAMLVACSTVLSVAPVTAEDMIGEDRTAPPALAEEAAPVVLQGTLKKARASGFVTIGYRVASFPFSFAGDGAPIGYSIELCAGIIDEMSRTLHGAPLKTRYVAVTADDRQDAAVSEKVDLECGSTTSNVERQKSVAFSPVIFVTGTRLMVKRTSGIESYRDLAGKTLVVTIGTTNEAAMRLLNDKFSLGMRIVTATDHQQSYDMLAGGGAEAFATDDVLLYGFIAANKSQDRFEVVGDFLSYDPYGIMYRRNDPQMADVVARAFSNMARSGSLVDAYSRWFLGPTPTGVRLNLPLSTQLTEIFRAMGADF